LAMSDTATTEKHYRGFFGGRLNVEGEEDKGEEPPKTFLTQSSQLYLETVVPSCGHVVCFEKSYRAERSTGPRHLCEYLHIEAEMPFCSFEELLEYLEDLVRGVIANLKKTDCGRYLIPEIDKWLEQPFVRMSYLEGIEFCRQHNLYKKEEEKTHFEPGDDIPSGPERQMIDMIGRPVLFTRFPAALKSFYMKRTPLDPAQTGGIQLTESVDLLLPGVGETIGASLRIDDYDEIIAAYKRQGIDPTPYYWYTDLRKYGCARTGGYGLGFERFCMALLGLGSIREACLYPRAVKRCSP